MGCCASTSVVPEEQGVTPRKDFNPKDLKGRGGGAKSGRTGKSPAERARARAKRKSNLDRLMNRPTPYTLQSKKGTYEVVSEIGRGHFAKVMKCVSKENGHTYALKVIYSKDVKIVQDEVAILAKVRKHPNVVSLRDVFQDDYFYYIVMDLCEGGDLFSKIADAGKYSEQRAAKICSQIASALQYIHELGVVHRDLKPENILLSTDDENSDIKVADFGLSKLIKTRKQTMKTVCGTWAYCAPEVIEKHPYQEEVDNWTLGVLMFILLSGYHPFDVYGDLPEPKLLKNVRSGRFDFNDEAWNDISEAPKELIRKLLKVDAKERMSLKDFLKSEWISSEGGSKNKQLDKTLERMQRFNAIRKKFRGIVLMIAASERMRRLSMNSKMEREGSLSINHKNGSKPSSKAGSFSGDVSNTARLSEAEIIKKALAGLEPGELSGPSSPTERKGGLRSPNTLGLRRASSPTPSELNTVTEGSEVPATVDIN